MERPKLAKRGRPTKWDFSELNKKGDFILLPRIGSKKARSCRASAKQGGIPVSVLKTLDGGYVVTLLSDR